MSIYRITVGLRWAGAGSPGANVWHYRVDGSQPVVGMEEDVADGLDILYNFYNVSKSQMHSQTFVTVPQDVLRIDTDPPESVAFTQRVLQSSGAANEAPEMLALCINWHTSVRTRRGRGRTFFGPLSSSVMDVDGTPDNVRAGAVLTSAKALVAAGNATDANGAFGVYSRTDGLIRDFTDASLRVDQFAVLRSRRD